MVGINPGDKVMSQVLVTKRDEVSRAKRAELKRKKKTKEVAVVIVLSTDNFV